MRFEQVLRCVAYTVVFGAVIAASVGFAGPRTREVRSATADMTLTVTYAQITRPGIATPFQIAIDATGSVPLPDELTVEVPSEYMAMFDENGIDPEPDAVSSDGVTERWTFRPAGEPTLHIDFDARLQPNIHSGRTATVKVDAASTEPVEVRFHTWVLP